MSPGTCEVRGPVARSAAGIENLRVLRPGQREVVALEMEREDAGRRLGWEDAFGVLHRREVSFATAAIVSVALATAAAAAALAVSVLDRRGPNELSRLIDVGKPVYCGGGTRPYVALTFDDGPTPWSRQLVAVLRRNGARATFFEIGMKAARHPDLAALEAAAGEVGDHSWSHPTLSNLGVPAITRELGRAQRAIAAITRRPVRLTRPPFGATDPRVAAVAQRLGLVVVLWNVDSGDASAPTTPPAAVVARQLTERVKAGAIVLLHEDETVPTAVDAMRMFLPVLRRQGLHAVTVSELLQLDPPAAPSLGNSAACHSTWTG